MAPGEMASNLAHRTALHSHSHQAISLWDRQSCVPLINVLGNGDLLILLSPVIAPSQSVDVLRDPFEPFGRALAARHPWVRHVPYTAENGITSFHVTFIKKAKVLIFVVAGVSFPGQRPQVDLADVARLVAEHRPLVIVACQNKEDLGIDEKDYQTILQIPGHTPRSLEHAAAILFGEASPTMTGLPVASQISDIPPKQWEVETLPDSLIRYDVSPVVAIWNECLPEKFSMDGFTLKSLLDRDGFGKHYVVKLPETGETVGFCATYTTWAFSDPDDLVGSLAVLLVKPAYRNRGIGLSLYNYAKDLLTRTRGVKRLQLGSTFPRLLSGIPRELASQGWFRNRGWNLDSQTPGCGKEISDWHLKVQDWPSGGLGSVPQTYVFRQCTPKDFAEVLEFLRTEASRNETMGLFEEYKWSRDSTHDIVLCLDGDNIVATALTYMANSGTIAENDLPWARRIGFAVGGITCICIAEGHTTLQKHRNSVMIRLLGTCIEYLQSCGMNEVFIDGVRGGDQGFQDLGFRKWAVYRDVWQTI
ncbi:hypothetical protein BKA67DRAFT_657221 [Truncatella angustata]|uniref:N-acetyltransferase domain-containing protein n=1 Tax=Truncatella angustata TaxID=152316 RepID=A0A9P8ZZN5_9PEZI|nr:uncharacterized protein BKA67DRAFT_657221 [Truncatella angustata]KAH6655270.1 hypothetical protein BKA67DRAFT_657221 [Truncatella angustata]